MFNSQHRSRSEAPFCRCSTNFVCERRRCLILLLTYLLTYNVLSFLCWKISLMFQVL